MVVCLIIYAQYLLHNSRLNKVNFLRQKGQVKYMGNGKSLLIKNKT